MSSYLSNLLPELAEEIFWYCSLEDLKNVCCCNSIHLDSFKLMLWHTVEIPWEHLDEEDFECFEKNSLKNLAYTHTLSFRASKSTIMMAEFMSQQKKQAFCNNYMKVIEHCASGIIKTLSFIGGLYINIHLVTRTFELLKSIQMLTMQNLVLTKEVFLGIANLMDLEYLCLEESSCTFGDFAINHFRLSMSQSTVPSSWEPEDPYYFTALSRLQNLKILNIRKSNALTEEKKLLTLQHLKFLQEIDICNSALTDQGLKFICLVKTLKCLKLGGCFNLTDAGISYLPNLSEIQQLHIYCCGKITDYALTFVSKLEFLQQLDAGFNNITDIGIENITSMPFLSRLSIGGTKVLDKGISSLSKLSTLRSLSLRHTMITDQAMLYLLHLPNLVHLNLRMCSNLTVSGISLLEKMKSLRSVDIRQLYVGMKGVLSVAGIDQLKTIKCDVSVASILHQFGFSTRIDIIS